MTPHFSIVTVTYGRTTFLSEAMIGFLGLSYDGKVELIICNTCPQQKLQFDTPKFDKPFVTIFNLEERPKSLGEARNFAIMQATGTHLVLLDDDDYLLPEFLNTLARYWTDDLDWILFDKQFLSFGDTIKEITPATNNAVCFTKAAWEKIGGYQPLTVGEDTQFVGKLSSQCKGKKITIAPQEIGFIYSWGAGNYHASGLGPDSDKHEPAHVRVEKDFIKRVANGSEPVGIIRLKPHSVHDWPAQAKAFLEGNNLMNTNKSSAVCIVELGRYGDICNILPVAKAIHDTYGKPVMMVSREFASILDGISYVQPYAVDLPYNEINKALEFARKEFKFVICAQIWGKNFYQPRNTDAYNKESWRNCGFLSHFDDLTMLPLFDLRDAGREAALLKQVAGGDKPFIVVQVTNCISSPFPEGPRILEEIRSSFGTRFHVVDVSDLRCECIYDLLGLMDKAACVVAIDTALLHLAAASDVPVVALVNPNPWAGTALRCHCAARLTYFEVAKNPLKLLFNVELAVSNPKIEIASVSASLFPPVQAPTRSIFHAYDQRNGLSNASTITRLAQAQLSWNKLYEKSGVIPVPYITKLRTADKTIGDPRDLPYLKDMLKNAMDQAQDEDLIVFTNNDVWLHPELADLLRMHVSIYNVCTSRRCEVKELLPEGATPEEYAKAHNGHMGRDLIAAKKSWLVKHWDKIPDAIIGSSSYDLILAYLVREYHGVTIKDVSSLDEDCFPAELPVGFIAHVAHKNHWSRPDNYDSPSEKHNRGLYEKFVAEMKGRLGL